MNLHGVPLRTARGLDPATVKRVGSSASRQMRGRGDGGPYGFGARGGGALLGLGDAPIVAKLLAVGLGGRKRRLVRAEIASRSCSATAARIWIVNLVAVGLSQQTKSTLRSINIAMNARLRLSRSSSAMTSFALCFLQAASAFSNSGRSLRLPLSSEFIRLLCGAAAWPLAASAQQPARLRPCYGISHPTVMRL
jgi:hypothetical protein